MTCWWWTIHPFIGNWEQVLEAEAFRLHFARNGEEAVQLYEKCSPSIVLTDWMLPDFSGLELCKKIRADKSRGYTYITVMTSNTERLPYFPLHRTHRNVTSALAAHRELW